MAHDDLCVCSRKDHAHFYTIPSDVCMCCKCADIAQIRADEREQAAQRVAAVHYINSGQPVMVARMRAIAAARGEQP